MRGLGEKRRIRVKPNAGRSNVRGPRHRAVVSYVPFNDQGNVLAQLGLGLMHANGRGVPQDAHRPPRGGAKAADQRYADAQVSSARCTPTADAIMVGVVRTLICGRIFIKLWFWGPIPTDHDN